MASAFSESETAIPSGMTRWICSRNSHHPVGVPTHLLAFANEGVECRATPVVSTLVEPAVHQPLRAFDLGFPGNLSQPPQPGFRLTRPECQPLSEALGRQAGDAC